MCAARLADPAHANDTPSHQLSFGPYPLYSLCLCRGSVTRLFSASLPLVRPLSSSVVRLPLTATVSAVSRLPVFLQQRPSAVCRWVLPMCASVCDTSRGTSSLAPDRSPHHGGLLRGVSAPPPASSDRRAPAEGRTETGVGGRGASSRALLTVHSVCRAPVDSAPAGCLAVGAAAVSLAVAAAARRGRCMVQP